MKIALVGSAEPFCSFGHPSFWFIINSGYLVLPKVTDAKIALSWMEVIYGSE